MAKRDGKRRGAKVTAELMTPTEAGRLLGVSADTVRTLSRQGRLATLRTAGGQRLFQRVDVEQLKLERAKARKDR